MHKFDSEALRIKNGSKKNLKLSSILILLFLPFPFGIFASICGFMYSREKHQRNNRLLSDEGTEGSPNVAQTFLSASENNGRQECLLHIPLSAIATSSNASAVKNLGGSAPLRQFLVFAFFLFLGLGGLGQTAEIKKGEYGFLVEAKSLNEAAKTITTEFFTRLSDFLAGNEKSKSSFDEATFQKWLDHKPEIYGQKLTNRDIVESTLSKQQVTLDSSQGVISFANQQDNVASGEIPAIYYHCFIPIQNSSFSVLSMSSVIETSKKTDDNHWDVCWMPGIIKMGKINFSSIGHNPKVVDSAVTFVNTIAALSPKASSADNDKLIREACSELEKPNDLARVALACRGLAMGDVGEVPLLETFDDACWASLETLTKINNKDSERRLDDFFRCANLQGSDLLRFSIITGRDVMKLREIAGTGKIYASANRIAPEDKRYEILTALNSAPFWSQMKSSDLPAEGKKLFEVFNPMLSMPPDAVRKILLAYLDGQQEKPGKWGNLYIFNRLYFDIPEVPVKEIGLWKTNDKTITTIWPLKKNGSKFTLAGHPSPMRPNYSYSAISEFDDFLKKYKTRHEESTRLSSPY